jgi:hypothetical protein
METVRQELYVDVVEFEMYFPVNCQHGVCMIELVQYGKSPCLPSL